MLGTCGLGFRLEPTEYSMAAGRRLAARLTRNAHGKGVERYSAGRKERDKSARQRRITAAMTDRVGHALRVAPEGESRSLTAEPERAVTSMY